MQKYYYKYQIYTDNLCYGVRPVSQEYRTLKDAKADLDWYRNKYGCCTIKRVRFTANT